MGQFLLAPRGSAVYENQPLKNEPEEYLGTSIQVFFVVYFFDGFALFCFMASSQQIK